MKRKKFLDYFKSYFKPDRGMVMRMSVKSKYFLMTALNNLRSRVKLIRHKLSCKEASFVSLNNIDSISILLNEDNDLEEVSDFFFIFKIEKNTQLIKL